MKIFYPAYYNDFRCIAGACPDSCCKEWTVDVDPESAEMYRTLPGPLGDRLRQVLTDSEGAITMRIENGRCPMWRLDGLCRIQAEHGHDALCKTCRDFPRLRHDYDDFAELDLELSCPEAARLILSADPEDLCVRDEPGGEPPQYDTQLMATLLRSRNAVLSFLNDPRYPLPQALAAVLLYAYDVQQEIDGAETVSGTPQDRLAEIPTLDNTGDMRSIFAFLASLEILTPRWRDRLAQPPAPIVWCDQLRALARYAVRRYWLQSVADYDLVCRAKFAIIACLVVAALGGNPTENAQLFSKEIENDPDNVEAILDGAYTAPALTDANLLALLLP